MATESSSRKGAELLMEAASEQARKRAIRSWAMYDWANSAFITTIGSAVMPIFFGAVAAVGLSQIQQSRATQVWGLTTAFAALIVAILAIVLGPIADCACVQERGSWACLRDWASSLPC